MAQFVNIYKCDLHKGPVVTSLHQVFLGDVEANRVGVRVTDNGEDVTLSGTCSGTAILCNGGTVALTGTVDGSLAYVDLPSAVYTVEGPVEIYVTLTQGDQTTTLLTAHGNAVRTDSGVVIDPGTIIPSVAALISDIDDAVASIPADYSDLLGTIAPDFSSSTAYTAGQYVWYSGTLYRFTSDHAAGSWTGTDAIAAEIGEDVTDLKGAVGTVKDLSNDVFITEWEYGTFNDNTGDEQTASTRIRSVNSFDVKNGETAQFAPPSGFNIDFYMWQNNVYIGHNGWTSEEVTVNPSSDTTYRFIIARGSNVIEPSDGANATIQKQYMLLKQIENLQSNQNIVTPNVVYRPQVSILDGQHLMAHRGGYWGVPLNSMYAFKEGYRQGFSIIECDVQVTSDDVVVICHDRSINSVARNSDGTTISETINVDEHTYNELLEYDFGISYGSQFSGTKICRLTDFLLFCKRNNIMAYVDTDSTYDVIANVPTIYNTVKDVRMLQNTFFDCQTYAVIDAFIALDTKLNLVGQRADSETAIQRYYERVNSCNMLIASCGENYYSPNTWTKAYVDSIHQKGLGAKVTKPNASKEEAIAIFNTGTDFLMVNNLVPYTFYDY